MKPVSPRKRLMLLLAAVAAAFGMLVLVAPHSPEELRAAVDDAGVAAPLVFVLVWTLLTPALCSGTLLALAGGLALGLWPGALAGLAGATLGGLVAFAIARGFGARAAAELSGPRLRRVQERVERRGFLAVLVARATPGVPATLLNYACGLARVRARDFAAASALGGAPRIVAYTALGASGGDVTSAPALAGLGLIALMALAGAGAALHRRAAKSPALAS